MMDRKIALVTGASSGLGAIYARRLAALEWDLVLTARDRSRLKGLAGELAGRGSASVEIIAADLATADGQRRVADRLRKDDRIGMLVNNAGIGSTYRLGEADPETMDRMIQLNVAGLTRLALAAGQAFAARGSGTIINMASIVALAPALLNGVYGASKAFVLAFSEALADDLSPKGVRVQAVLPGATATGFWELSGTPVSALPPEIVMDPEAVIDAALAGLAMGERVTIPSLPDISDWEAFMAARARMLPNLSHSKPAARYRHEPAEADATAG